MTTRNNDCEMSRRCSLKWLAGYSTAMITGLAERSTVSAEAPNDIAFLFSYFKGNGEDGLHLAYSLDGLIWEALNGDKPLTSPSVGGKLMRDPSIVQGPNGLFHMVWSSGWWDLGFGYASSKDLIEWSPHQFIPVNQKIVGAKNTWAPDLFYENHHGLNRQFVVTFATTIPGRFPDTEKDGDHNHRLFWVKTTDFEHFSEPELAFDPGYNCIDGTIYEFNCGLTMIYKDERPGHKTLHAVTSPSTSQPWSGPGEPILNRDWVEGPTVLNVGHALRLYFDCYQKGHYGAAESDDGVHWKDITEKTKFPQGMRHGTAFRVRRGVLNRLLELR